MLSKSKILKIMKTKFFILPIILFSGLLLCNPVISQEKKQCDQKCCLGIKDLTDEQKLKIEEIHNKSEKKVMQYKADLKIKKAELEKLKIADSPSQKDINSKIDEISSIKANIEKEEIAKLFSVRNELTAEQKSDFNIKSIPKHHNKKHHPVKAAAPGNSKPNR